jgi:hypothetical protein
MQTQTIVQISRQGIVLEGLYRFILGESFRYKFGIQGAYFDLFLWNVLMVIHLVKNACVGSKVAGNEFP